MGSESPIPNRPESTVAEFLYHRIINIPENIDPALPHECCIYKVPVNLRQVNGKAYTPMLISIGPIHHGRNEFLQMEKQKQRYFHFFWERLPNKQALVLYYENNLRKNEQKIRSCYSEKHDDKKTEFVDMILLDAVFIMELFLRNLNASERKHDYMFTKPWISRVIQRDLLLLENQLPIFVLKELFDAVVPEENKGGYGSFIQLAHKHFESFDPLRSPDEPVGNDRKEKHRTSSFRELLHDYLDPQKRDENLKNWENSIHFTDLIRYFYLPKEFPVEPSPDILRNAMKLNEAGITFEKLTGRQAQENKGPEEFPVGPSPDVLRNAIKLNEAGITFEKLTDRRLLDIKFERKPFFSYFLCLSCLPYFTCFKARLLIPQLKVDHTTECVLRNLIAFEQCHHPKSPYICNYVSLIDSLIHTTDDVELLVETQVLVHELGSHKELATLVNGLCKHVVTDSTCYFQIISDLNKHYKNIWNRSMAALRLVYFRDPWRSSSTLVGVVVLIFAIFQFCRVIRIVF